MSEITCPDCGKPLRSKEPGSLCPSCLLKGGGLGGWFEGEEMEGMGELGGEELDEGEGRFFGEYELLEELAHGGMGVVFKALHRRLNRMVALKRILSGRLASEGEVKRFLLEAEAAARLDHPSIVPIYEAGEVDGQHFFSMRLMEGGDLQRWLRVADRPLREVVEVIMEVGRAVAYSHARGVLHRDLKPSNVLMDSEERPHLSDFGLAKINRGQWSMTQSDSIVGTPNYLAPEQVRGELGGVTTATDVYGLGALLYEGLTGHPPFEGGSSWETLRRVVEEDPVPVRELNRKVDHELEIVCLKCLEKDPQNRYPTVDALVAELDRWLRHEPIEATRISWLRKVWKWSKRHPAKAVVAGVSLAALGVITFTILFFQGLMEAREIFYRNESVLAQKQEREAVMARDRALSQLYALHVRQAAEMSRKNFGEARKWLDDPVFCPESARDFTWRLLRYHGDGISKELPVSLNQDLDPERSASVRLDPSGRWMAWSGDQGVGVRQRNGREVSEEEWVFPEGRKFWFSQGGQRILVWNGMEKVSFRMLEEGREWEEVDLSGEDQSAEWSWMEVDVQGKWIAMGHKAGGGSIYRRDASGWGLVRRWEGMESRFGCFSVQGKWLMLGLETGALLAINLEGNEGEEGSEERWYSALGNAAPDRMVWDPLGWHFAVAYTDGSVALFRFPDEALIAVIPSGLSLIRAFGFLNGSNELLVLGERAMVWSWESLEWYEPFQVPSVSFSEAGYLPENGIVWIHLQTGEMYQWQIQDSLKPRHWGQHRWPVWDLDWDTTGGRLFVVGGDRGRDGGLWQWDRQINGDFERVGQARTWPGWLTSVDYSEALEGVMVGGAQGIIDFVGAREELDRSYAMRLGRVNDVVFSPDGLVLAYAMGLEIGLRWMESGRLRYRLRHLEGEVLSLSFTSDGKWLASGGAGSMLTIWEVETGIQKRAWESHETPIRVVRFGSHDRVLATAGDTPEAQIWWLTGDEPRSAGLKHDGPVHALSFSPDGKTLATGGAEGVLRLWSVDSGELLMRLYEQPEPITAIQFSPDGRALVFGDERGNIQGWSLDPQQTTLK